jgi:selenocysteine-specific elongation factor
MPQTIEHLAIADLLGVKSAIIAIAKADKVASERVREVKAQITALFGDRREIKPANILPVSIYQADAIAALKSALLAVEPRARTGAGFFRYYCDRVFTAKGRGVVVTGAVLDGEVKEGDKIVACDLAKELSVRAIETHNEPAQKAVAGDRAALNVKGAEQKELYRGVLLAAKGYLRGFNRIGVIVRSIGGKALKHDDLVQFFIGANRFEARLLLLEAIAQAGEYYAEIVADREVFAVFGDRFILRNGGGTIGGGEVLTPIGDPLGKAQKLRLMRDLSDRKFDAAFATLIEAHKKGFGIIGSAQRFGLSHEAALAIAKRLEGVFIDENALVIYDLNAQKTLQNIALGIFAKNRRAMLSAQTLSDRFKWASAAFIKSALEPLLNDGKLKLENSLYRHIDCDITDAAEYTKNTLYDLILSAGFSPEAPYNIYDSLDLDRFEGDKALKTLTKQGKVTRLAHNLFVASERLSDMMEALRALIKAEGYADVQSVKSRFNLSRKYAVAYLERLDQFGDIRREDNRRLLI